ncbi:MAG: Gfo/Idh/MocA family oxidoreductase [Cyanobacteria bacterium P01_F01_bin.150]
MTIRVGLIGTGYAAKKRAAAFIADRRSTVVAIASQSPKRAESFAQSITQLAISEDPGLLETDGDGKGIRGSDIHVETDAITLINRPDIDLVVITTENHLHGHLIYTALMGGKHVVVEYPLSLDVSEAEELIALAKQQYLLLHVEHIEVLSSIHLVLQENLKYIGSPSYGRYASFKADRPAPERWSYHVWKLGFPLVGALSRLNRLINIFGPVAAISCQAQFWDRQGQVLPDYPELTTFASMVCSAQMTFTNGMFAELVYGKGECIWTRDRILDIHGSRGRIVLEPKGGTLILEDSAQPLSVGSRRGLFAQDTAYVLDFLDNGTPIYISPEESLYALKVADAARRSAETRETITEF